MLFKTRYLTWKSRPQIHLVSLVVLTTTLLSINLPASSRPSPSLTTTNAVRNSSSPTHDQGDPPWSRINELVEKRRGAAARQLIDKIKPTDANNDLIHMWRGMSFRADREPELAVEEFDKCKNLKVFISWANYVAGSYCQAEKYDKAIAVTNVAIAKEPSASLYGHRATYLCAKGKFAEAIPDYKKAAALKDDDQRTYLTAAGDILRRQGKSKEALALLNTGLSAKGKLTDGKYWLCRANCFGELGEWAKAAESCTEGIRISKLAITKSKSSEELVLAYIYVTRAKCYDHLGKKDLAERDRKAQAKIGASTEDIILGK